MSEQKRKSPKEYKGRPGFEVVSSEKFGIQRKIVANMTVESWDNIPHSSGLYEPDATELLAEFKKLRQRPEWQGISLNTVMLYVIAQGLTACPAMNSWIKFNRRFINGVIERFEDVNISMPTIMPDGTPITINVHNCERMGLREMQDYINDMRRKMANTNMDDAMYEVGFHDTMQKLKSGRVVKALCRLIGAKVGCGPIHKLKGEARKEYFKIPKNDRITRTDIEQGTIVVSNVGSVYRGGNYLAACLLEIIPPQVCAICISCICEKPGVVTRADGTKELAPRQFLPITLAVDHRAMDFGDCMPFIACLDEIFKNPSVIESWL
ncbi:MAG: 2-oxo acid dehydrogenase subunit E2 [Oscillospiraceae bacterium]|nr:2-oxo acid dehydrogenase subunit E2 [Oscillospiraceae bacterium]